MPNNNIPISYEVAMNSYDLPVTKKEIIQTISIAPEKDLEGLCGVIITSPRRNKEFGYFGKYDLNKSTIYLFAQLKKDNSYLVGQGGDLKISSLDLRKIFLNVVILHEIGHHVGFKHGDLSENFAKMYARAIQKNKQKWRHNK